MGHLRSKLPDIYVNITSSQSNGIGLFTLDYKWDATGDNVKQFLVESLLDSGPGFLQRAELMLMYPGHHIVIGGDYTLDEGGDFLNSILGYFRIFPKYLSKAL